ncbi:MAG: xanthine dehydrogenase family protein subunit M [Bryobacterales bacterium]|nr:xanthine dehydrogenase family protein subunit M [Bryobacteraceae bacterium]MDW8129584.1 xanthine dehydrogenase family protein subunit M [Bryobacterales bacterium]
MKWFDYAAPGSLTEAFELLARHPGARPLAGGTDLLVQMRAGERQADLLVDVKRIPELNELGCDASGTLRLGAAVPCCVISESELVRRRWPALAEVAAMIGGVPIQSRASLGGNLCNAAPSADGPPVLMVLRAICRVAGPSGERRLPVEEFCIGPGKTVLAPGELLVGFEIPPPEPASGACYLRFTPRAEMDIAVAGAAAAVRVEGEAIGWARLALSAVAPTPLLVREAGEYLAGKPATEDAIRAAAEIARDAARPISDVRGTAEHRRRLVSVLAERALRVAVARAREAQA